ETERRRRRILVELICGFRIRRGQPRQLARQIFVAISDGKVIGHVRDESPIHRYLRQSRSGISVPTRRRYRRVIFRELPRDGGGPDSADGCIASALSSGAPATYHTNDPSAQSHSRKKR